MYSQKETPATRQIGRKKSKQVYVLLMTFMRDGGTMSQNIVEVRGVSVSKITLERRRDKIKKSLPKYQVLDAEIIPHRLLK